MEEPPPRSAPEGDRPLVERGEAAGIGRFTDDKELADESSGKDEEEPERDSD